MVTRGLSKFLFLGATELEHQESSILNIHQESNFVNSFTKAKKLFEQNSYDVFVINKIHLLEHEVLKFLKLGLHKSFLIVLCDTCSLSKYNFVDCYLRLDNKLSSKLLINTISLILKQTVDDNSAYSLIKRCLCKYEMLGISSSIKKLKCMILGLKDVNSNIMITGESGTGKELVARMLNKASTNPRSFIPINCSSIPEALFESELFGYKKGAFTGALCDKKGLVEQA